jgi:glycerophosphoryl diester phosphodiesterase
LRGVVYAHRGLHGQGRVENSMGAFAAALEAGLGIECDVQRTSDGRAVVFHDWELDRLTIETGAVAARSVAELAGIELHGTAETIPTLRDLLELVRGRVPLLIELKSRKERPVSPLCRAVLRDLEGYLGPHAVMSFDPRVGHWFAGHSPVTVRGLVVSEANARTFGGAVRRHVALWRTARFPRLRCARFAESFRRRPSRARTADPDLDGIQQAERPNWNSVRPWMDCRRPRARILAGQLLA